MKSSSLDFRVGSVVADGASVSSGKSHEAIFTPINSPGVLDHPISSDLSNKEDSVVHILGTVTEDSGPVGRPVSGVNSDRDGSACQSILKISASLNVNIGSNSELSTVDSAALVSGNIGVFGSSGKSLVSGVIEGRVHPTSVASLVSIRSRAIN